MLQVVDLIYSHAGSVAIIIIQAGIVWKSLDDMKKQ